MTPRDYRQELAHIKCWDSEIESIYQTYQAVIVDCLLQNREELLLFCKWIEEHNIQSYLEIGVWTGRLLSTLDDLFHFKKLGAADLLGPTIMYGLPLNVPPKTDLFIGDSHSVEYMQWRQDFGEVDLVFIDGDHSYEGVALDYKINSRYQQRYMAFHDILAEGVREFWAELEGEKTEIICVNREAPESNTLMGIGILKVQ